MSLWINGARVESVTMPGGGPLPTHVAEWIDLPIVKCPHQIGWADTGTVDRMAGWCERCKSWVEVRGRG